MTRIWVVELSLNGAAWSEIASFEDEQEARRFAQQQLFSMKRANKDVKIRVRAELRHLD